MDKLDENLRELKRQVDARVEQMLFERRAETLEAQSSRTGSDDSTGMIELQYVAGPSPSIQSAFPLPEDEDPTVVVAVEKPTAAPSKSASGYGENEVGPHAFVDENSPAAKPEVTATKDPIELDPDSLQAGERVISHLPAIRHQGWLRQLIGRFRFRKI